MLVRLKKKMHKTQNRKVTMNWSSEHRWWCDANVEERKSKSDKEGKNRIDEKAIPFARIGV
jgi:hypothetical protein